MNAAMASPFQPPVRADGDPSAASAATSSGGPTRSSTLRTAASSGCRCGAHPYRWSRLTCRTSAAELLALLPLSTGAAILVTIVAVHDSLLWPMLLLVAGTGATAVAVARGLPAAHRTAAARRLRTGLVAGIWATVAYDLVRFVPVAVLDLSVDLRSLPALRPPAHRRRPLRCSAVGSRHGLPSAEWT